MDHSAWRLFIDAAELGSLTKVAVAHGTTQPQVSRTIKGLEAECGGPLFLRTGRGVVLNELGQRIAPEVRAWLASTEQLVDAVRASVGQPIGKVRIGSLPSMASPLLTTLFRHVRQRYPLIQLAIREGQGAQIETWLEDGSVDLAVLYRTSPTPRHGDVYLVEAPTYLVSAADDLMTSKPTIMFSRLDDLPLIQFCRPNSWTTHLDKLAGECGISLRTALEADSLNLQMQIVADGGVYALLGPYAIAASASGPRLRASKITGPVVTRFIALATSRQGKVTFASRTVMQELRSIARLEAAGMRSISSRLDVKII